MCKIRGFLGTRDSSYGLLGYNTIQTGRLVQRIQRNLLPTCAMKFKTKHCSETLQCTYQITTYHNLQEHNIMPLGVKVFIGVR